MGKMRGEYRVLVGKPQVKSHLGDITIDGRIILKYFLKGVRGWIWFRIERSGRLLRIL
jgi:hypothetical protein